MKKDFLMERQGKTFVLYAELLDLAHEEGLKSILTQVVQIPDSTNGNVAICTALVTLAKDGVDHTFSGIGDAAPMNVAPAMQKCLLRMAETRAKARALRDAVNIGTAAFEELAEDDAVPQPVRPAPVQKPSLSPEAAAAKRFKQARDEAGVIFSPLLLDKVLGLAPGEGMKRYDEDGKMQLVKFTVPEFAKMIFYCNEQKRQIENAKQVMGGLNHEHEPT